MLSTPGAEKATIGHLFGTSIDIYVESRAEAPVAREDGAWCHSAHEEP